MLTGQILLQLLVILLVTQLFGYACRRIGQQWVIGEILAGIALGPSLLGAFFAGVKGFIFPASALPTLQTLGDIGLVLYMFSLGASLDTHLMLRQSRKAVVISLTGILLPFIMGMVLAFFLFPGLAGPKTDRFALMFMVGTALAITAFPVLARLLLEKKMLGTYVGTLALTCAAVDDVIAWCLLALVIAIVQAKGLPSALLTVGFTVLFIASMLVVVRPLLAFAERHIHSLRTLVTLTVVLLLFAAYITNVIGIHPIFGAFLMGITLPRKTRLAEFLRSMDQANVVLFLPLYFVYSGLRTRIDLISAPSLWLICLLILVIACTGKIGGGAFSMRFMGETWRDSFSLGLLMNTRGLVELIVLNIGLDLGVLSPTLFSMLVIMALVTTMITLPLLTLLRNKPYLPPDTNGKVSTAIPQPEEFS